MLIEPDFYKSAIFRLCCSVYCFSSWTANTVFAYQPDAPYLAYVERHEINMREQDAALNRRLGELAARHGTKPNIVYILADDIGWGELGSYGGGKVRGTPTPQLDKLAAQGMKFLSHYSEPSCTPTRVALMTGRIPVRTGLDEVLFPGQTKGLVAEEYTLAELLSDAGYATAMFGKWHLGELPEHQPTNQGFDYAYYNVYNGGPWPWMENSRYFAKENETVGEIPYFLDIPEDYEEKYGIKLHGVYEGERGKPAEEVSRMTLERYNTLDDELTTRILDYLDERRDSSEPFFIYYASNANQVFACPPKHRRGMHQDSSNCQAAQLAQHDKNVGRIVRKLETAGMAENTLLVWMSDNGPMYEFFPSAGYSFLRGSKHTVYEGGIRTPAFALWPGVIAPGQDPIDLIHVTDWFTTAARMAGAVDKIPDDRITDGIDQTALLLAGEGQSRRNYMFHYEEIFYGEPKGMRLAAVRLENFKQHINQGEIYNIIRDPGEKMGNPSPYIWLMLPMRRMVIEHNKMMESFPNRVIEETAGSELDLRPLPAAQ